MPREQVRQEPYPLPKDFEWTFLDINNSQEVGLRVLMPLKRTDFSCGSVKKYMTCCHSSMLKTKMLRFGFNIPPIFLHGV